MMGKILLREQDKMNHTPRSVRPPEISRPQCPECGEEYSPQDGAVVPDLVPVTSADYWLRDRVMFPTPYRKWTCLDCDVSTHTIEIDLQTFHELTDDSADKVDYIAQREAQTAQRSVKTKTGGASIRMPSREDMTVSPELATIIGSGPQTRPEAMGKFWAYIKSHRLQDKTNPRLIHADEKMRTLFGKDSATLFEIAGVLSKHLV